MERHKTGLFQASFHFQVRPYKERKITLKLGFKQATHPFILHSEKARLSTIMAPIMVPFTDPSCLQQQLNSSQTMKRLTAEHFIINSASQHAIISHKHLENYRIKFHLLLVSSISMFLNKILCLQSNVVKMYFGYTQDQRVKGQEPSIRMRYFLYMKFMSLILRLWRPLQLTPFFSYKTRSMLIPRGERTNSDTGGDNCHQPSTPGIRSLTQQ